jgi:hypothetical protein
MRATRAGEPVALRSRPMRIRLLAVCVVALPLAFAACGGGGDGKKSSPSTTKPSTTAPASTAGFKVGDEGRANGTQLSKPTNPDTRQIDPELACRTFVESPEGNCDIVMMAGGNALWTAEPLADTGTGERPWRVRIRVRSKTMPDGGWDVALQLPDGATFASVAVKSHDVTDDGKPIAVAAHREGLHKGSVAVDGKNIVDYSADEESPECCPTRVRRTVIGFEGDVFRVTNVSDRPIEEQPPDLFA